MPLATAPWSKGTAGEITSLPLVTSQIVISDK